MPQDFFQRVWTIVRLIPYGKVATYGQIAFLLGDPRGARTVGWALHSNPYAKVVPCHRVVNKRGELSGGFAFGGPEKQRFLLEEEGVRFLPDGRVDLARHLWCEEERVQGAKDSRGQVEQHRRGIQGPFDYAHGDRSREE